MCFSGKVNSATSPERATYKVQDGNRQRRGRRNTNEAIFCLFVSVCVCVLDLWDNDNEAAALEKKTENLCVRV